MNKMYAKSTRVSKLVPKFPGDTGVRRQKSDIGMFESISVTPRGKMIHTRHQTMKQCVKHLEGVERRHTDCKMIDHRPRNWKGELI